MAQAQWILAIAVALAGSSALANYQFGADGVNGRNGFGGASGRDGQSVTIVAQGQTEQLDLSGGDGSPGGFGAFGSDAYSCYQPNRPDYDVYGADGGDGGDGGYGGSGGDGGSVRAYYADVTHLKNIYVDSSPGQGAFGGQGERGGNACRCYYYSWTNQVCREEAYTVTVCNPVGCSPGAEGCACRTETRYKTVCENRYFYCRDGQYGRNGISGRAGSDGTFGSVQLVGRLAPLEQTTPSMSVLLEQILASPFLLTRHEWDSKQGALTLFAPGSKIRDSYQAYAGKSQNTISFAWLDQDRKPSYYASQKVNLSLSGRPATAKIEFGPELLVDKKITAANQATKVQVLKSMRQDELTKIRVEEMTGSMENLTLTLIDDAKVSDVAQTKIYVEAGWELEAGGAYRDWVPANLIRSEKGKIHINLGRIPGIKASKLKKYFGEKCSLEIEIDRSFVGITERVRVEGKSVFDIEKDIKKQKPIVVKMEN
jgi:hypothetical protein